VVVGPTGVFALAVTDGPWSLSDIKLLAMATRSLAESVPPLAPQFHPAIVVGKSAAEPREWFADDGAGAWVVGDKLLLSWLHSFPDHAFDADDVARVRAAAQSRSDRSSSNHLRLDLTRPGSVG
jgi:hypothetical protein